jgi:chemotaxis protein methyltransferase WspC
MLVTPLDIIALQAERVYGLDPASLGASAVRIAVQARMRHRGVKTLEDYATLLGSSEVELAELVEEMVVPETWFFRDRQPFLALARWAVETWLPAHPGEALRILSVPCASGEEPYTIVMALLDAGVSPDRFVVEGVDVSQRLLAKTRTGVYGRNSFRGNELGFRDRYFRPVAEGYGLADEVRRQVHFRQGNLLDPLFFTAAEPHCDVIFCRNLLIYFAAAAQQQAVAVLKRMLVADGLLFVGHAEMVVLSNAGFAPVEMPLAFAFRPRQAAMPVVHSAAAAFIPPPSGNRSSTVHRRPAKLPPAPPAVPRSEPPAQAERKGRTTDPARIDLEEVRQLADSGQLEAAVEQCRLYLQAHGPTALAYYLMGLARDAAGAADEASENYRKALYLEPNHYETLVHLALLAEKMGDRAGARRLQERVGRLSARMHGKAVS